MKLKTEIPEPLFKEMIALFGEKETERISKSVGFNYHLLVMKVTAGRFKQKYGISLSTVSVILIIIFATILFLTNGFWNEN
jgi:hypothetical protein